MRFNLRFLLVIITIASVLVAALFALPSVFAAALTFFLLGAVPAVLASGVYFGAASTRAFCVGALIPILPNTLIGYLLSAPSILVADEVHWWSQSRQPVTTLETLDIMYRGWNRIGHALLALQLPIWVIAVLCGLAAIAARNWIVARYDRPGEQPLGIRKL